VWAVATLPRRPNLYLTASADKTIKLWENDKQLKTFTGMFGLGCKGNSVSPLLSQ